MDLQFETAEYADPPTDARLFAELIMTTWRGQTNPPNIKLAAMAHFALAHADENAFTWAKSETHSNRWRLNVELSDRDAVEFMMRFAPFNSDEFSYEEFVDENS